MSSKIFIKVEATPGDDIGDAIVEAVALATRMQVCVEIPLNGVKVFAKPGADALALFRAWEHELGSRRPHKFATT